MHQRLVAFVLPWFLVSCGSASAPGVQNRGADKAQWWDELPRAEWLAYTQVTQPDPWFEVYEVFPNTYAIYEPGHFEEVISYLIIGSERALLFDSGLGIGNIKKVVDKLTDLPLVLLNSHSHYDHIGDNHRFTQILGADTPYGRERAKGLAHAEVADFVAEGWIWKTPPATFSAEHYAIAGYQLDEFVSDEQIIQLGDRQLQVLLTPGHAPDALCLLDPINKLLFTGDTFYLAPLYAHLPGADQAAYRRTARALAQRVSDVEYLLPAHNITMISSDYLSQMAQAFTRIDSGTLTPVLTDGAHEYGFGEFSIIVPAPP